jgi:hypothetical protein
MTAMTGPACREVRQLLGVYVVGAIDPAERSIVDYHLSGCPSCREELSGLAGLPALLGRVPREEVERMGDGALASELTEPPAELLNGLLRRVSVTRRSRRVRSVLALAAAVAIAAGAAGAAVNALSGPSLFRDSDHGTNGQVTAVVDYAQSPWGGTDARIGVTGIPTGSECQLWANVGGHWVVVDGWRAQGPEYTRHWYDLHAGINAKSVQGFKITSGQQVLLSIPG